MHKLIVPFLLFTFSCGNRSNQLIEKTVIASEDKSTSVIEQYNEPKILPDSIKTIIVDDYPVTNDMFRELHNADPLFKMQSGQIFSIEKAWFTNDTINQTLVFELYTDFHRFMIFHFQNDNVPDTLISQIQLYNLSDNTYKEVNLNQKKPCFQGFIDSSKRIDQNYFISSKGLRLNDNKEKILKLYGQPDKIYMIKGIECYDWDFYGDELYISDQRDIDLKGKPLALNSFGHHIKMYFTDNLLIALILINDIP
jgi:hypothetical protein